MPIDTRLLIELGGLVVKAGLHERVDDDRATLLDALLLLDDLLRGADPQEPSPDTLRATWRKRGLRAFDRHAAEADAKRGKRKEDSMGRGATTRGVPQPSRLAAPVDGLARPRGESPKGARDGVGSVEPERARGMADLLPRHRRPAPGPCPAAPRPASLRVGQGRRCRIGRAGGSM